MKITYLTEAMEYSDEIDAATTKAELLSVLDDWSPFVPDAIEAAKVITDFEQFRAFLIAERSGHFAGEDHATKYGHILLPDLLLEAGVLAGQYHAPFGTALIQLGKSRNLIKEDA